MTVTIITEKVMAHRRAGEICPPVTGSTGLTPKDYAITAHVWVAIEARPLQLARLLLSPGIYAGLSAPVQSRPAEKGRYAPR